MADVLVVTDIFGCGKGLQSLLRPLLQAGIKPVVLDPYQGRNTCFKHETEAYQAFLAECGHDGYLQKIRQYISDHTTVIIAFSAGATAVWRVLGNHNYPVVQQVWLFYPGHLHQYLHLQPSCPVQVILPATEQRFCVKTVAGQLLGKRSVQVKNVSAEHGFMNFDSANYDAQQSEQQINILVESYLAM